MKSIFAAVFLSLLILSSGCGAQKSPAPGPQPEAQQNETARFDPGLAEKVAQVAKTVKGVDDSTAVVINNEISAAVKVKGFARLRLKSIKEEVHKKVSESNKGYTVYVTSDKKLFSQLRQVESKIKGGQAQSPADIQKKVKKINDDMQG